MDFSNPESRIEAILQNMLGANNVLDPPESRIEYLLQQILENGGGGGGQSAIHVKGVTTTALTDGCDTNPITINGESYTAVDGDLVAYQSKEFLFNGTIWQELGDVSEVMTIIEDILEDIAPEFDATASYAVDDYVLKDGVLYKCTTAHTGAWDENDFTATTISDEITDVADAVDDIKDGTEIDSFGDVETALTGKQDTITAGTYIQKSGDTISVKRDVSEDVDEILTLTQDGYNLIATLSIDGTVIESETFTQEGGTFIDLIAIDFNVRAVRWHYTYLKASKNHGVGYDDYIYSSPYTDTFVVTIGEENKLIIKSELEDAMSTKQDTLTFDDVPTENSNNPVKSGGVKSAIDAAVSSAYHHAGTKTCAELVAGLLVAANEGNVYNMTDSGTTTSDFIEGQGQPIKAGDNVGIAKISDGVYKFDLLSGFVDTTNFVQKSVTAGLLKNDGTVNDEIEGDVSTLKSGLTTLDNEVNGDATTYDYADVITIEDAVPSNVADCNVKIEPVQDLHGYDHPWVGGAGKNKLPLVLADIKTNNTTGTWSGNDYTINGVVYTVQTDDDGNVIAIKATGTPTGNADITLTQTVFVESGVSYVLNGCPLGGSASTYRLYANWYYDGTSHVFEDGGAGVTCTWNYTSGTNTFAVMVRIANGVTIPAGGFTFLPMLRLATETDATFAPYTNLCPISGHTEASVQRDGKNLIGFGKNTTDKTAEYRPTANQRLGFDVLGDNKIKCKTMYQNNVWNSGYIEVAVPPYADLSKFRLTATISEKSSGITSYNPGFEIDLTKSSIGHIVLNIWMNNSEVVASGEYFILDNVQLEYGETATDFVPYAGKTYTIALGDTVYGGTVDFDSGVMTVDRAERVYDGSEDEQWEQYIISGDKPLYRITVSDKVNGEAVITLIDNIFTVVSVSNRANNTLSGSGNYVDIIKEDIATVGDWKTWLSSNPLQVCYYLATPFTVQLTPQQIQLLKGQNTLTASTGDISVTVNGVSGSIGSVQEQVNELAEDVAEIAPLNYSTTEQKTGQKWIDGKDIYFKVVEFDNAVTLTYNAWYTSSIDATNVDNIISASALSDGAFCPIIAATDSGHFIFLGCRVDSSFTAKSVILFYTKTA